MSAFRALLLALIVTACASTSQDTRDGLHVRRVAAGSGPVVVVPGASFLAPDFGPLCSERDVVFYDLRGRGRSEVVPDAHGVSLDDDLRDLEALRRALGLERFTLIGWSYYGALALRYALSYPERVERLVLVAPLPPRKLPYWRDYFVRFAQASDPADQATLQNLAAAGTKSAAPIDYCRAYERVFVRMRVADPAAAERAHGELCVYPNSDPAHTSAIGQAIITRLGNWDWRTELAQLDVPVLVVHGSADALPLEGSHEYVELLAKAQLVTLAGCGNLPWIEQPTQFFDALEAFLGQASND